LGADERNETRKYHKEAKVSTALTMGFTLAPGVDALTMGFTLAPGVDALTMGFTLAPGVDALTMGFTLAPGVDAQRCEVERLPSRSDITKVEEIKPRRKV
jgi:hypothetical protein